jgi:hypothetical protein
MSTTIDTIPDRAPLTTDSQTSYISPDWYRWLFKIFGVVSAATHQVGSTFNLTGQHAAITASSISLPALANGSYRVTSHLRVTTPDAVSSAVQLTIGYTESSVTLSASGANLTGNTTSTVEDKVWPMVIDQNSAITYSTSYSSNTPGQMQYKLTLLTEAV